MPDSVDIFISGGGIAGLAAAAAFAGAGFDIALADPAPPAKTETDPRTDLRSTAFLRPARALFERIGVWPALAPHAVPLQTLRLAEASGAPPEIRESRDFDASDIGTGPFGWNLPNWLARRELLRAIADKSRVRLYLGTGFSRLLVRSAGAIATLSDGTRYDAKLAIAADGRDSPMRDAAGIGVNALRYGQKALAFAATHPIPHGNVSTEIYDAGGAFTTVPLQDHSGEPASAVVWMNDGPRAVELAALAPTDLGREATVRSCNLLGRLTPITSAQIWPVVTQTAERLTAERVALAAEAAHVLPPIGAQGLNASLLDIETLLDIAESMPDSLGEHAMLDAYARRREPDIALRARAIDIFNRLCRSGASPVRVVRRAGLLAVHDLLPLRHFAMSAGLGDV